MHFFNCDLVEDLKFLFEVPPNCNEIVLKIMEYPEGDESIERF